MLVAFLLLCGVFGPAADPAEKEGRPPTEERQGGRGKKKEKKPPGAQKIHTPFFPQAHDFYDPFSLSFFTQFVLPVGFPQVLSGDLHCPRRAGARTQRGDGRKGAKFPLCLPSGSRVLHLETATLCHPTDKVPRLCDSFFLFCNRVPVVGSALPRPKEKGKKKKTDTRIERDGNREPKQKKGTRST
nr:hypothetical protein [Pandoravirus belohorizontensis]